MEYIDGRKFTENEIEQWDRIPQPPVSPVNSGRVYFDITSHTLKLSQNGGAYSDLTPDLSAYWQGGVLSSQNFSTTGTLGAGATTVTSLTDTGNLNLAGATQGVQLSATTGGILTLAGIGNTNNENLTFNFEGTADRVDIGTGTGVTNLTWSNKFSIGNSLTTNRMGSGNGPRVFNLIDTNGVARIWRFTNTINQPSSIELAVGNNDDIASSSNKWWDWRLEGVGGNTEAMILRRKTGGVNADYLTMLTGGYTGFGVSSPTAIIHLKAGTATAGTAPLKFTAGTPTTVAVAGQLEYATGVFQIRADNLLLGSTGQLQFNASTEYINSANAGYLDLNANTGIRLNKATSTAYQITSTLATGTSPFAITSTTVNTNLNADMTDGKHVGTTGNVIPLLDGNNTVSGSTTHTGSMIVKSVTDAGPMTATNGTVAEIVFNTSDSKFYGCTVTGTPATWAALN